MIPMACKDPVFTASIMALDKAADVGLLTPDDAISGAVDLSSYRALDSVP